MGCWGLGTSPAGVDSCTAKRRIFGLALLASDFQAAQAVLWPGQVLPAAACLRTQQGETSTWHQLSPAELAQAKGLLLEFAWLLGSLLGRTWSLAAAGLRSVLLEVQGQVQSCKEDWVARHFLAFHPRSSLVVLVSVGPGSSL